MQFFVILYVIDKLWISQGTVLSLWNISSRIWIAACDLCFLKILNSDLKLKGTGLQYQYSSYMYLSVPSRSAMYIQ